MPAPLSLDLRKRIVEAVEDGASYEEAARRFGVGEASVSRFMRRWRETGSLEPSKMGGRRFGITDEASLALLKELVEEKPDAYVEEIKQAFEARSGKSTSRSAIKRSLAKLGFRRKKKGFVATERETERVKEARKKFAALIPKLDARRLVFIDETWTFLGMARPYARSKRGDIVTDTQPAAKRRTITLLGALTSEGLSAAMTVDSGTDTEVFLAGGEPSILYFDGYDNNMKRATRSGGGWEIYTVTGLETAQGLHNEVAVSSSGTAWAACYDYTDRNVWIGALD